jgi:hypothetical protein
MRESLNDRFDIVARMRNHWATCAFACALIATLPARLVAQTPASDDLSKWGLYARLAGQTMKDVDPKGFRLHWRWQTPGEVLLEEWYGTSADSDQPAYVMTIRLGPQPGTLNLKSSTMMGKEWLGTLQADGGELRRQRAAEDAVQRSHR